VKQSILTVLFSSIIVLLSGCGDESTSHRSSTYTPSTPENIPMELNRTYTINKGDTIKKIDEEAVIKIVSDLNHSKTTATLLKGEADIVRANQ